jgi:hypothetical protein
MINDAVIIEARDPANIPFVRSYSMQTFAQLVQLFDLMVARGGIEPPTRGFSVQIRKPPKSLTIQLFCTPMMEYFAQLRADKYLFLADPTLDIPEL